MEQGEETKTVRLILHIGRPKTGTTSLQHFLYLNRDCLSASGFLLFDRLGMPNNIEIPAYFAERRIQSLVQWSQRRGITTAQEKDEYFSAIGLVKDLDDQIATGTQKHHTAIISSEQLVSTLTSDEEIDRLSQFMHERFTSIKVVCFVRPQVEQIPSGWSTTLKNGGKRTLATFTANRVNSHALNYADLAGRWSRHFGSDNLYFSLYRSSPDWDIRRRFAELHLDDAPDLQFPAVRTNRSYMWLEAQLVRLVNIAVPLWPPGAREPSTRNLALRVLTARLSARSHRRIALSSRKSRYVRAAFRDSNRAFSSAYLREGESLE